MPIAILILLLSIMSAAAVVIDPTNRVDWTLGSTVGVPGGIPYRSTIYRTLDPSTNTATVMNAAIAACPSNQVILLLNGTHTMSASIDMAGYHGVTIRGQSTNAVIDPSHNSPIIKIDRDPTYGVGTAVTSGFAKGATNLTVASTSGLSIGNIVKIDQVYDTNNMWSRDADTRSVRQLCRIDNIDGSVVTVWPPLHYGLTPANTPLLKTLSIGPNRLSGLENLTIDGTGQTTAWGILLNNTYGFYITNVMTLKINSYHIYTLNTLFNEYVAVHVNDSPDYEPNHGGILLGNLPVPVTGTAIYDCVFNKILPGIQVNAGSSGCLIAYNYFRDSRYGATAQAAGCNMNHGGVNIGNLYEGNISNSFISDGYFGGSWKDVLYRNWATGWTETFTNLNSRPIHLTHWTRYAQLVGNVIGCTNIATVNEWRQDGLDTGYEVSCIYSFGYPSGGNNGYDCIHPPDWLIWDTFLCKDQNVTNTMNLHGNWDSYNKSITWDAGNADHTLPDSMYLASKPSWFGNLTWPPFTPANGYTNLHWTSIPAGYRYVNGTNPPAGGGGDITSQPQTRYRIRGVRLRQ